MFTCSILFMPVSHVYAWNGIDVITKFSQDVFESIASVDPNWKQQVITKNLAGWQAQKEELLNNGQQVPQELETVLQEKSAKLNEIQNESSGALSTIIDIVQQGNELLKIREYVSDFHRLKSGEISPDQQSDVVTVLESNVNNLGLVKKYCMHVYVNDLLKAEDPYEKIKSDYCPVLQDVPKETVMASLVG